MAQTVSELNKAAARAVFEIWSSGNLARLDEFVASDVVHHDPYDPHGAEGLVGMKRTIEVNRKAFPDMQLKVEDQIAEGDKVVTRWRGEMTHLGPLGGLAATDKRVTISGMTSIASRTARSLKLGAAWICSPCSKESEQSARPDREAVQMPLMDGG